MTPISFKQQNPSNVMRGILTFAGIGILLLVLSMAYIWFSGGSGKTNGILLAPATTLQPDNTRTLFQIMPEESEARFHIDELLLGDPKTVIGTTNQVAGQMLIDFDNLENSTLSTIRINVRTLETDNEFRNRALRGQILEANQDEFEFAEFMPTELIALPATATFGEAVNFQIKGNLTVHGVTQPITFDATITPIDEARIEGNATATITYHDFDISIPEAPGVANVSEQAILEFAFVAIEMPEI